MIAVFLPPYPFRGEKAPYLWVFYRLLTSIAERTLYITGKDYLAAINQWELQDRWEVSEHAQRNLNYRLPNNERILSHSYHFLSENLFSEMMGECKNNPISAFRNFLTKIIPSLEAEILHCLAEHEIDNIEAVLTWTNCPSLSSASAKLGIPVIHLELGPLRPPYYRATAYFDFSGVNGNTEAEERYSSIKSEANIDRLSLGELRNFFFLSAPPKLEEPTFAAGIALQVEDDSNLVAYGNGFDNCSVVAHAKLVYPGKQILVRAHPGSRFKLSGNSKTFCVDHSENSIEFISKCKSIISINSSVALEAVLMGVPAHTLGDASYRFVTEANDRQELVERLSFYLFAYLVPFELIFDVQYLRFRLTRPHECEIVKEHTAHYLSLPFHQ